MLCGGLMQPIPINRGLSIMAAPLTMDDLEKLPAWFPPALSGASSTAETKETAMQQRMKPWWRSRGSVEPSIFPHLWLYSLVVVCIVIGLLIGDWLAETGSCAPGL